MILITKYLLQKTSLLAWYTTEYRLLLT